jgi:hypothetical protein
MKREIEKTFDGRMANGTHNLTGPVDCDSDDEKNFLLVDDWTFKTVVRHPVLIN